MIVVAIPEALREKLGPEGARALAELLNEASVRTRDNVIEIAASRFERQLAEEIGGLRAEFHSQLHSEIGGLRAEFHSQLHSQIGGLRTEMYQLHADLVSRVGAFEGRITRWMFVFWIGQIGALLGILFAFFRT
ncbi:MAG: hypothetical protein PVJ43_06435 [Gemmatimonadales bacterium]